MRILTVLTLWLAVVLCPGAGTANESAQGLPVIPRDGTKFSATGVLLEDGVVTFSTAGGARQLPLAELIVWGAAVEPRAEAQVLLADGSLLVGEVLTVDGQTLTVFTDTLDEVAVATSLVRGVLFHPPASPHARDLLAARAENENATSDRLVLVNGDELTGTLLGTKEVAGRLTLRLRTELGEVAIEEQRVAAALFNPALIKDQPPRDATTLVGFSDGSLLFTQTLSISAEAMQATLTGGLRLVSDRPGRIVLLQPLSDSWTYLSDLKARSYKHVPYLSVAWPYRNDRNAAGSRLRADSRIFAKGLGMHSASRLMYVLDKPHQRFDATLAIDDLAKDGGSVVFRVYKNLGEDWQPAFVSDTVRGSESPTPISVDIQNAKAILLMVDFADRGDQLDYANWIHARLIE